MSFLKNDAGSQQLVTIEHKNALALVPTSARPILPRIPIVGGFAAGRQNPTTLKRDHGITVL
ncbi:hypothetical protein K443DRAFT_682443 [Laccaria amethystina LaAM-08-1]|uniref:Uncharacterized protein n=1 Tax=Laccaria amethystina LaAM-08-1 TaxID=1095629 RepID=A0A0C9XJ05_9AGAR|nr:hypothetical protein K443DRAFT_682443 [Laccaria amethystina LaAM-08-1]